MSHDHDDLSEPGNIGNIGYTGTLYRPVDRRVNLRVQRIALRPVFGRTYFKNTFNNKYFGNNYHKHGHYRCQGEWLLFTHRLLSFKYQHFNEFEEYTKESYWFYRKQLPNNSANFLFVPMLDIQNMQFEHISLPENEFSDKITIHMFVSLISRVAKAWIDASQLYFYEFLFGSYSKIKLNKQLDAVMDICIDANVSILPNGMTVSFIYQSPVFLGLAFQIHPFLLTDDINPIWSGSTPTVTEEQHQVLKLHQELECGRVFQDDIFIQRIWSAVKILDKFSTKIDNIESLSHKQVIAETFTKINKLCQPVFDQLDTQVREEAKLVHVDVAQFLLRAHHDFENYSVSYTYDWKREEDNAMSATSTLELAYYVDCSSNLFLNACMLPIISSCTLPFLEENKEQQRFSVSSLEGVDDMRLQEYCKYCNAKRGNSILCGECGESLLT